MKNSCFPLGYRKAPLACASSILSLGLLMMFIGHPLPAHAQSKELHIAAASDLQPVLPALAAEYEHATGVKVIPSFGSSATLTQQLTNGDPQDVFLSADYVHPEELVAAGLTTEKAPIPYAHGVLVLWARHDSPAQPLTLNMLTSPKVKKIAIANGLHAPYGLAADKALQNLNLTDKVSAKLVVAENIAQTAQFAESGNAQAGLISLTIASSPHFRSLGTFVRIPTDTYPEIRQCAVILKSSKNQEEAEKFLHWLTSPNVQQRLKKFGLDPAE
ncbi:MAG: molybdate ABC transporter substrate-binding protein [Acidobacteriaceae bacterium]